MKIFKNLITGLLGCLLVVACCFSFVGCDNSADKTNSDSNTPHQDESTIPEESTTLIPDESTTLPTYYNAEFAEAIYYDAAFNTLVQSQRKVVVNHYDSSSNGAIYELVGPYTTVLKDNVYCCLNNKEWLKAGKLYNEDSRTYKVLSIDDADNFISIDFILYCIKSIESSDSSVEFKCATIENNITKVYVDFTQFSATAKITITIQNNLISEVNFSGISNGQTTQIIYASATYDNVDFPRAMPSDFNAYTAQ